MVTHMSVKLRERPVVRKAMRTGVPQRLLPLAFQLCAALLGWLGARRRSGRIWPPVRLCGGFFRLWVISHAIPTLERLRMAKNRLIWGLYFVRSSCYTCLGVYDMPPERSKTR